MWKAVCLITQPASRKEHTTHVQKVRRVFATCVMLFNRHCSFPLHTAIADGVESCGGYTRLQQILNRVRACVSIGTHARYVQHRLQEKSKQGAMSCSPPTSFMAVSTDNLDYNTHENCVINLQLYSSLAKNVYPPETFTTKSLMKV